MADSFQAGPERCHTLMNRPNEAGPLPDARAVTPQVTPVEESRDILRLSGCQVRRKEFATLTRAEELLNLSSRQHRGVGPEEHAVRYKKPPQARPQTGIGAQLSCSLVSRQQTDFLGRCLKREHRGQRGNEPGAHGHDNSS